jgi:uncharacterized protein (UPF0261 family)
VSPSSTAERTVLLIGTLDTKGDEFEFLRERLSGAGVGVLLADVGTLDPPAARADLTREQVAAEAGVDVARWPAPRRRWRAGSTTRAGSTVS